MNRKTKTWTERLHDAKAHQVKPAPIDIAGMKAGQIMLVPTALMVDVFIRTLPNGRSLSARQLRDALAAAHGAEVTCPITTGFHLRTVAEAAWEALAGGTPVHRLTPVWRVLPPDSLTLKKLSFDSAFIRHQRELEGLDTGPVAGRSSTETHRTSRRT
jgi:hypothetical protein